jgi:hypothetical protein
LLNNGKIRGRAGKVPKTLFPESVYGEIGIAEIIIISADQRFDFDPVIAGHRIRGWYGKGI